MIFSSLDYFIFFAGVLMAMAVLRGVTVKKAVLLGASYYFYAHWDPRFTLLMFGMSAFSYVVGNCIAASDDDLNRRRWLAAAVVGNLAVLAAFKYYNFFVDAANVALATAGVRLPFLEILLPVGISFITFEVISYAVDIYRRTNAPADTFWDLALLVAFFPHLVAGPILKPQEFLPQLRTEIRVRLPNLEAGAQLFLLGLVKKVLIADQLAPFVDAVFAAPGSYAPITVQLAVVAYAIQIYCDFSGYTDMAIGSARCLGFEIPRNFDMPYVSRSITEFWRRWHISLSTWLRDYLYISLGGNRCGKVRQYANLMTTMVLGGLWHGASWNFVAWGALHGAALVGHKAYAERWKRPEWDASPLYQASCWAATFGFVCFAWVFFRSPDFGTTLVILGKLVGAGGPGVVWTPTALVVLAAATITAHYFGQMRGAAAFPRLQSFGGMFAAILVVLGLLAFMPSESTPFIYFQF